MYWQHGGDEQLSGTVEIDETYVGGKKRGGKRGRGTDKAPVFGMLERGGDLVITPVDDTKKKTLEPIIKDTVKRGTRVMTDEYAPYKRLNENFRHGVVNHGRKEYARGIIHVNSLEGAWGLLKRTLLGTYHRPSKGYLDLYCSEFQFSYNTRNNTPESRFRKSIRKNKVRVKYNQITPRQ